MVTNIIIITLVSIAIIAILIWFLRKNRRDRKDMERTIHLRDVNPEKHKDEQV
ncbi:hypothetical protein ACFS6J_15600 [Olivibacter jilunii]|uniref:LPXTG cell wall anchor domain-containing protein n=1 Tax=Olivibacter jilunii TaxID=985016 RepID=A0ABW6B5F3_9SPHI